MKQSNKLPKTGVVARCSLSLEIEDERVGYEILAPPRAKSQATDQVSRGGTITISLMHRPCSLSQLQLTVLRKEEKETRFVLHTSRQSVDLHRQRSDDLQHVLAV